MVEGVVVLNRSELAWCKYGLGSGQCVAHLIEGQEEASTQSIVSRVLPNRFLQGHIEKPANQDHAFLK